MNHNTGSPSPNKTISNSDIFVRSVMTNLPKREGLLLRARRMLVRFILSPLWLWSAFSVLVMLFHRPIQETLYSMTTSPTINLLLVLITITTSIAFMTMQMCRDLRHYRLKF